MDGGSNEMQVAILAGLVLLIATKVVEYLVHRTHVRRYLKWWIAKAVSELGEIHGWNQKGFNEWRKAVDLLKDWPPNKPPQLPEWYVTGSEIPDVQQFAAGMALYIPSAVLQDLVQIDCAIRGLDAHSARLSPIVDNLVLSEPYSLAKARRIASHVKEQYGHAVRAGKKGVEAVERLEKSYWVRSL